MFGLPTVLATLLLTATPQQNIDDVVILEFTSPRDPVCMEFKPVSKMFLSQGYPLETIDVSQPENAEIVRNFRIGSYPSYVIMIGKTEFGRVEGRDLEQSPQTKIYQLFIKAQKELALHIEQMTANQRPGDRIGNNGGARGFGDMRDDFDGGGYNPARTDGVSDRNSNAPPFSPAPSTAPAATNQRIAADPSLMQHGQAQHQGVLLERGTVPWLESSVRLRVIDPGGFSNGTGTIIDVRDGVALIVTCGHIFRKSKELDKVEIYLNGPNGPTKIEGECWYYNCATADIGFVVAKNVPKYIRGIQMAPENYDILRGQNVISVGCNGGADPSVAKHTVISTDRLRGPNPNSNFNYIQVTGASVQGRSGGGLFSENGYLIGVCWGGDPIQNDGHFTPLHVVRSEMKNVKQLKPVLESQSLSDSRETLLASRDRTAEFDPRGNSNPPPQSDLVRESSGWGGQGRYLSLEELYQMQKEGAEITCLVRSNSGSQAREERFILEPARERMARMNDNRGNGGMR